MPDGEEKDRNVKRGIILAVAVSLISIFLIFKFTATNITFELFLEVHWEFILLAFLFHVCSWFFWAGRLKILGSHVGHRITYKDSMEITLVSAFFASITPSSAGGEPVRVKLLSDKGKGTGSASAVVLAERTLDAVFFLAALPPLLLFTGFSVKFGLQIAGLFFIISSAIGIFIYIFVNDPKRGKRIVEKFYPLLKKIIGEEKAKKKLMWVEEELMLFKEEATTLLKSPPKKLVSMLLFTLLLWMAEFLIPSIILMGLHHQPYFLLVITSQLLIVVLALIPITPGGSGIAEGSMVFLYSQFVSNYALGIVVALWRGVTYFSNLIVGMAMSFLVFKDRLAEKGRDEEDEKKG